MQPQAIPPYETEGPAGVSATASTSEAPVTTAEARDEIAAGSSYTAEEEALVEERLRNLGYL